MQRIFPVVFSLTLIFVSCTNRDTHTPKPRGFQRIEFPTHNYVRFHNPCNYSLAIPAYSKMIKDNSPNAEECWYNLNYLPFNATLHLSYKQVINRDTLFKLINDSRTMVYKHVNKADEIIENYISDSDFNGVFYELNGATATNAQFYVTDSLNHFLRGSLYFNTHTDNDSIYPVLEYLKNQVLYSIKSLNWDK